MNAVFGETRAIYFFFGGTIASFAALAARNFTTILEGILIASPDAGLRPMRALRWTRTKRPRPGIANTPVLWERSAISERTIASRFENASLLAASETNGNEDAILAGRAMMPLLWHALSGGARAVCGSLRVVDGTVPVANS